MAAHTSSVLVVLELFVFVNNFIGVTPQVVVAQSHFYYAWLLQESVGAIGAERYFAITAHAVPSRRTFGTRFQIFRTTDDAIRAARQFLAEQIALHAKRSLPFDVLIAEL